jgi:hypothetical protein
MDAEGWRGEATHESCWRGVTLNPIRKKVLFRGVYARSHDTFLPAAIVAP